MTQYIDKSVVVAEIERLDEFWHLSKSAGGQAFIKSLLSFINTLEVKEVDYERELSKYVSNGIHRFFPNVDDDYCKMDSVIWQGYVIETAKYFFELGLKASQEEKV